jgi:hypothetical protein
VVFENISIVRRRACCAPGVILMRSYCETPKSLYYEQKQRPVRFIKDDNFVSARWQSNLLLSKRLDFISHYVDSPDATSGYADT